MIAADGGNYDKEGKIFPPIIEKLGLGLKICNSSIRIYRGNEQCMDKMKTDAGSLLTSG